MERLPIDEVESRLGPAAVRRILGPALETTDVAINYYELDQGDSFGFGYHRHEGQEELFYVQEGTVTFETETGEVRAGPDEVVRFEPGEWQLGTNEDDQRVVALAIGAPKDAGETEMVRECPECGQRTHQSVDWAEDGEALVTLCVDCGAQTERFE